MAQCFYCQQYMESCDGCTEELVEFVSGLKMPVVKHDGPQRCHDCNCSPGFSHHPGCDSEKCPRCGGQLMSCGCLSQEEEPY